MKIKNKLSAFAYEILIERNIHSFSLIDARNIILKQNKNNYTGEELYKHLYRQMMTLYQFGYLTRSIIRKVLYFSVTDKFLNSHFEKSRRTQLFENVNSEDDYVFSREDIYDDEINNSNFNINQNNREEIEVTLSVPTKLFDLQKLKQELVFSLKIKH